MPDRDTHADADLLDTLRQLREQLEAEKKVLGQPSHTQPCPHCGFCPVCGRGPSVQPYTQPFITWTCGF